MVAQPPPKRELEYDVPPSEDGKYWFPFLVAEKGAWTSGQLANKITLYPLENFPMYASHNRSNVITIFAPPGRDKK